MTVQGKPQIKIRKVWAINPATRIKKSKKIYSRQKLKHDTKKVVKNEE